MLKPVKRTVHKLLGKGAYAARQAVEKNPNKTIAQPRTQSATKFLSAFYPLSDISKTPVFPDFSTVSTSPTTITTRKVYIL